MPSLPPADCWNLLDGQPVARLATIGAGGRPHLVPIVFAVVDGVIVTAVDHKPKTTPRLRRLANIETDGRVAVLFDHYADDWSQLWWVRIDGEARIDHTPQPRHLAALATRYRQYHDQPPSGPTVVIRPQLVTGWRAGSPPR